MYGCMYGCYVCMYVYVCIMYVCMYVCLPHCHGNHFFRAGYLGNGEYKYVIAWFVPHVLVNLYHKPCYNVFIPHCIHHLYVFIPFIPFIPLPR